MRNLSFCWAALLLWCSVAAGAPRTGKNLACASCHTAQAVPQPQTSMGRAMVSPANDPLLQSHPKLTFQEGAFASTIERRGDQAIYSVTDGGNTVSAPIEWAFGAGAQTFVLEHDGHYYEGRLSYYPEVGGLDITVGDQKITPTNVTEAMGRQLSNQELKLCIGCHSTGGRERGPTHTRFSDSGSALRALPRWGRYAFAGDVAGKTRFSSTVVKAPFRRRCVALLRTVPSDLGVCREESWTAWRSGRSVSALPLGE